MISVRRHPRPRKTCAHQTYALTCPEFDELCDWAGHSCQLCGSDGGPRRRLVIDHDHGRGDWAVRGILCSECNTKLGRLENNMKVTVDVEAARSYLANPWIDKVVDPAAMMLQPEPELGKTVPVTVAITRWWGRFPSGWQVMYAKPGMSSLLTWGQLNFRFGPHRIGGARCGVGSTRISRPYDAIWRPI
jgi:hypothetical protein